MKQEKRSAFIDWRLALGSAPLGLAFAVLTITGWIHGSEGQFASAALIVIAIVVAFRVERRPFMNGFAAGFLAGLLAIETQALFLPTYFSNNPGYDEIPIPFGVSPRLATVVLGPLNAALGGLIVAILAWAGWRLLKARNRPAS